MPPPILYFNYQPIKSGAPAPKRIVLSDLQATNLCMHVNAYNRTTRRGNLSELEIKKSTKTRQNREIN